MLTASACNKNSIVALRSDIEKFTPSELFENINALDGTRIVY